MNIVIFITTYNRSDELKNTLESLCSDKKFLTEHNVEIEVWDDKSDEIHAKKNFETCQEFKAKYIILDKRHGKKNFWKIHNLFFKSLKNKNFNYVFSLQDDFCYCSNFLSQVTEWIHKLTMINSNIVCLNLIDNRIGEKVAWTKFPIVPVKIEDKEFNEIGWTDCVYVAGKKFFELLHYTIAPINAKRWIKHAKKSSGVGEQISSRLTNLNYKCCQPKIPFITHIGYQSKMQTQ